MSSDAREVLVRTLKMTAEQLPSVMLAKIEQQGLSPDKGLQAVAVADEVVDAFDELAAALEQGRVVILPREAMF